MNLSLSCVEPPKLRWNEDTRKFTEQCTKKKFFLVQIHHIFRREGLPKAMGDTIFQQITPSFLRTYVIVRRKKNNNKNMKKKTTEGGKPC